jgi:hypothetical protein
VLKFESNESGLSTYTTIWDNWWEAQTFTPQMTHTLTRLYFYGYISTYYGITFYARLRATSGGKPTGGDLSVASTINVPHSGGPQWFYLDMPGGIILQAGVMYAQIGAYSIGNQSTGFRWMRSGNIYPRGTICDSTNGGSSWSIDSNGDFGFQEWGNPATSGQGAIPHGKIGRRLL